MPEENYDLDIVDDPYANEEEGEGDNVCDDDSRQEVHFGKDGSILYKRKVPRIIYSVEFKKEHDKENYYRELVMLYIPWRNENSLLNNCISYEEVYLQNQHTIERVREKFVHSNTLNISNLANQINLEDESNCPLTEMQHTEEQDIRDGSRL